MESQARKGLVRPGMDPLGAAGNRRLGLVRRGSEVVIRLGAAGNRRHGMTGPGLAPRGRARHGRQGEDRLGDQRHGIAGLDRLGKAGHGQATPVRRGMDQQARNGGASFGTAGQD